MILLHDLTSSQTLLHIEINCNTAQIKEFFFPLIRSIEMETLELGSKNWAILMISYNFYARSGILLSPKVFQIT